MRDVALVLRQMLDLTLRGIGAQAEAGPRRSAPDPALSQRASAWSSARRRPIGAQAASFRPDGVSGGLNDIPELAVGTGVPDTAVAIGPFFFQHAEADQSAQFVAEITLQDHFTRWLGLEESRFVTLRDPQGKRQAAWPPEQLLAYFVHVHRRVPLCDYYLLFRIEKIDRGCDPILHRKAILVLATPEVQAHEDPGRVSARRVNLSAVPVAAMAVIDVGEHRRRPPGCSVFSDPALRCRPPSRV